jgi:hypothetical protein
MYVEEKFIQDIWCRKLSGKYNKTDMIVDWSVILEYKLRKF